MGVYGVPVEFELNWTHGRWLNKLVFEKCPNGMGLLNVLPQMILILYCVSGVVYGRLPFWQSGNAK